jgi:iron complex outermembrane receptor protein
VNAFISLSLSRRGLLAAALLALLLAPGAARGADGPDAAAQENAATQLPTVVVTAQKREENVQKVPMSITVVTDEAIHDSGVKDTSELMRYIPNAFVRDAGNYHQVNIRGVGGFTNGLHSPVGLYVDDVNLPNVFMQNPELFDVERVEVLKGPQGALYGRNSESGVINIVTRQPDNELRGRISTEYNAYDTSHGLSSGARIGAAASGPLKQDTLYLGLSGKWDYTGGFVKNSYDDDDRATSFNDFIGRGTLRWTPDPRWDVRFTLDGSSNEDGMGYGRYLAGPSRTAPGTINADEDSDRLRRANGQTLRVAYADDDLAFTSITGRQYFDDRYGIDMDMTPASVMIGDNKSTNQLLSQEFRLASAPGAGPIEWLTGVYAYKEDMDVKAVYRYPAFLGAQSRDTDIDIQGGALFGQATYTLFDRLRLTGGLRYDYIDMHADQTYDSTLFGVTHARYSAGSNGAELLPRVSVAYDLTANVMPYATVSRGYLAGGFDHTSPTSAKTLRYDPEYTLNYEIGAKTTWLDNRLSFNVALFHIDMDDKQVAEAVPATGTVYISNAAKAHSRGIEVEVRARPHQGWELFGSFGYTDTEVDSWSGVNAAGPYDYSGNELTYAPEYTYTVGAQYTHDTGFFGRMEVLGTGPLYHDAANTLREDGYELVNARVGYADETYEVTLWCKNAFDTSYNTVRYAIAGVPAGFDGASRQFGLTLTYKF